MDTHRSSVNRSEKIIKNNKKKSPNFNDFCYAKTNHINSIFEIEKKCFPGPIGYSKNQLMYLLSHPSNVCLIETKGKDVTGFLIIHYEKHSSIGRVVTIDVDPAFQNQGIGLRLLKSGETHMKQNGMQCSQLEVSENNKVAITLYHKAGYIYKEKIEDYYESNQQITNHAIRMFKTLPKK